MECLHVCVPYVQTSMMRIDNENVILHHSLLMFLCNFIVFVSFSFSSLVCYCSITSDCKTLD